MWFVTGIQFYVRFGHTLLQTIFVCLFVATGVDACKVFLTHLVDCVHLHACIIIVHVAHDIISVQ